MRGQFICSSTLCCTRTSKAQLTGATTSTLSTKDCASAVRRTGVTPWATTSGRKGCPKADDSFWKQEHICLSKVCGNTFYSVQIDHKVKAKPKLCDPIYSFIKAYKTVRIINFLRQLRIPVGHLDTFSSRSWLSYFYGKKAHCLLAPRELWSWGLADAQAPHLQDFPTTGLCRFVLTYAGIEPSQKKLHNYSGRPIKHPVPHLPKFYLQLTMKWHTNYYFPNNGQRAE